MNAVARLAPPAVNAQQLPLVRLSHTARTMMQRCGRQYRYRYVDRLRTRLTSAALGYGDSIHRGLAAALSAEAMTGEMIDPSPVFTAAWDEFLTSNAVKFSANWDADKMREVGLRVLDLFQKDWVQRGWKTVIDAEGIPVIERELRVRLPGNIEYIAKLDALVRTPDGQVLVVDFKTPMQVSKPEFYYLSDQLLGYQVIVDAHAQSLGIEKVDGAVFYELTKVPVPKTSRGMGPQIHVSEIIPRRSDEDIADWLLETQFLADDIRRKRFTRRPTDAFDSSCLMCDFNRLCRGLPDPDIYCQPARQ